MTIPLINDRSFLRLKSRYMSVALRGSPRGTLGTLRRTASLEYFLDMDKECNVEEVELTTPPPLLSHKKVNEFKLESKILFTKSD